MRICDIREALEKLDELKKSACLKKLKAADKDFIEGKILDPERVLRELLKFLETTDQLDLIEIAIKN
jgi:hypothetical protein